MREDGNAVRQERGISVKETEITFVIQSSGAIKEAIAAAEKIREAYSDKECTLRVVVKGVNPW